MVNEIDMKKGEMVLNYITYDKDDVAAEYALGGVSNQIFASGYVLHQWHNN